MNEKSLLKNSEVFVSTETIKREIYKGSQTGKYRKLASRLYTSNFLDSAEAIIKRNLWLIVGQFFPGGLLTDRTSLENKPSEDGTIYLISKKTRSIHLPGKLTIKSRKGHPPLKSDTPFMGCLYLPSPARAFLENMRVSRRSQGELSPTLSAQEIEERLEQFLQRGSEKQLNELRDQIKNIAQEINFQEEYKKLDALIGCILGTRSTTLQSSLGKARYLGLPYDPKRLERFQNLYLHLKTLAPQSRLSKIQTEEGWINLSFFESYFSNFIEGTEFEVSEAQEIIFENKIPDDRPQDAHDILGTYQIVSSKQEMTKIPSNFKNFVESLKKRHATLMSGRPDKDPGFFKKYINRVGNTIFVDPNLVEGTLERGFDLYKTLDVPFYRAVFMKFLISEVHPFNDGNGRLARIMMNAELVAEKEEKILIPTVYRGNYLGALRALTNDSSPEPLIRVLDFAQKYTSLIDWEDFQNAKETLKQTNAFFDYAQAEDQGIRLKLPN